MDIFCVVDGETDRHTIQYLHELEKCIIIYPLSITMKILVILRPTILVLFCLRRHILFF